MKLPLHIAHYLQKMLEGAEVPSSKMRHAVTKKMQDDGILQARQKGRTQSTLLLRNKAALAAYLHNQFGISNLSAYIEKYESRGLTRAEAVEIASNSKLRSIRTFKGFLVNCYQPVKAVLHGKATTLLPANGTFHFVYDYEGFLPAREVTIIGIENPENFRWITKQRHLFPHLHPLFVSRYPQSGDLVRWLQTIPNPYLHFGDFDFEGINIYLSEYKKHLGDRASFFIPEGIEEMINRKGNRELYNKQFHLQPDVAKITEEKIIELLQIIHRYKKVLEQEYLIVA
jgi:hypothetical protein